MITRRGMIACIVAVALGAPSVTAASAASSASSVCGSACSQYGDPPQTSRGPQTVGVTKKKAGTAKTVMLPAKAQSALKYANRSTRNNIERIVTSPYSSAGPKLPVAETPRAAKLGSSLGGSLRAAVASPGAGSTARLVVLLIAIVATTIAVGVSAIRRQRV